MEHVKSLILLLLPICLVSAVVAFLLPVQGTIFTLITMALAAIIGVLCLMGLINMGERE